MHSRANPRIGAGIGLAFPGGVWTGEEALEFYCRLSLLGVAILHWIVFALMVAGAERPISDQAPRALGNLAALVTGHPVI